MNLYISYSPAIKSRFLIVLFMICHYSVVIISAQVSSVSQSCLTLCGPMNCSTPGHKHQRGELLTVLQGRNNNLRNVIGSWLHFWSWYGMQKALYQSITTVLEVIPFGTHMTTYTVYITSQSHFMTSFLNIYDITATASWHQIPYIGHHLQGLWHLVTYPCDITDTIFVNTYQLYLTSNMTT